MKPSHLRIIMPVWVLSTLLMSCQSSDSRAMTEGEIEFTANNQGYSFQENKVYQLPADWDGGGELGDKIDLAWLDYHLVTPGFDRGSMFNYGIGHLGVVNFDGYSSFDVMSHRSSYGPSWQGFLSDSNWNAFWGDSSWHGCWDDSTLAGYLADSSWLDLWSDSTWQHWVGDSSWNNLWADSSWSDLLSDFWSDSSWADCWSDSSWIAGSSDFSILEEGFIDHVFILSTPANIRVRLKVLAVDWDQQSIALRYAQE